jgi:hypothetical protein
MSNYSAGSPDTPRMPAVRSRFGRRVGRSFALCVAPGIAVVVSLMVVGSSALPVLGGQAVSLSQSGTPIAPAVAPQTPVPSNATDCGLLSPYYIQGTTSSLGWPPSYAKDVEIMFAKLCNDTAFVDLLSEWGGWHWAPPVTANGTTTPGYWAPSNFTVQFGGSGPPSAWGNWTTFLVTWTSWESAPANVSSPGTCPPCEWQEYWVGSLPGTNYTGPNLTVHQLVSTGGSSPPGSSGPTGLFLLLSNAWFVGILSAVVIAVAISSLVVVRRRASRPRSQSGPLAKVDDGVMSGITPPVLGERPGDATPTHAEQGISPESSDPLDDAF